MSRSSTRSLLFLAFLLGTSSTLIAVLLPGESFAYRDLEAHVAIETGAAFAAGLAGLLAYGRAVRTRSLSDAILATSLLMLFAANGAYALAPLLAGAESGRFTTWAPLAARGLATFGLLAAALAGERQMEAPRRMTAQFLVGGVTLFVLAGAAVAALGRRLPEALEIDLQAGGAPVITAHPVLAAIQLVLTVVCAVAAVGFARQHLRTHEPLRLWLAAGVLLSAFAHFNQSLSPTVFTEYVYVSDFLRLAFYLMLLTGALLEIAGYQRGLAEGAVLFERRRMARDLHDGLAQELAYLTGQVRRLRRHVDDPERVDGIVRSAERALDESRIAISALHLPVDGPLPEALATMASEAGRGQLAVDLDVTHDHELAPGTREALLRIVAEAAGNAVRHGGASSMRITLDGAQGLLLRLEDDGRGFDADAPKRPDAYGLRGMRERTEQLGGRMRIDSVPERGTTIEVELP